MIYPRLLLFSVMSEASPWGSGNPICLSSVEKVSLVLLLYRESTLLISQ